MRLFDIFKNKVDYSSLTSEQQRKMIEKGELKPLYLIALRFGGSDGLDNMVYAPPAAVDLKNKIDDELEELMNQGRSVTGYRCIPSYKGNSGIPTRIVIQAFIDGSEEFIRDINI